MISYTAQAAVRNSDASQENVATVTRERSAQARAAYQQKLSTLKPEQYVCIDEAGVGNTLSYEYGWSKRGERCWAEKLGHFTERVSMIAVWCRHKVFAPMTFTGYCDSRVVETWFEQILIPSLKAGQVVILDNASFHRKARLQKLLEPLGCCLIALPPYSPDLNRIEPLWNQLKALIKHHLDPDRSFRHKVDDAFCSLLLL